MKFLSRGRSDGSLTDDGRDQLMVATKDRIAKILVYHCQRFGGTKDKQIATLNAFHEDLAHGCVCPHTDAQGKPALRHGGNGAWAYASCRLCGRRVALSRRGPPDPVAVAADGHDDLNDVLSFEAVPSPAYWADIKDTQMVIDSGCRRCVAGRAWHEKFQETIAKMGFKGVAREIKESFRYGDGRVVQATRAWRYPAGINKKNGSIDIAEVDEDTPPLLSRKALTDMGVILNFADGTMTIKAANLDSAKMDFSNSGHALLDVGDYGSGYVPEYYKVNDALPDNADKLDFYKKKVVKKGARKRLIRAALGVSQVFGNDNPNEADKKNFKGDRGNGRGPPGKDDWDNQDYFNDRGDIIDRGRNDEAAANYFDDRGYQDSGAYGKKGAYFDKGFKDNGSGKIDDVVAIEQPRRRCLKVLEIFTWTMAITTVATTKGWKKLTPISLETGYDLTDAAVRQRAWRRILDEKPDLVVMAFPCTPWSTYQHYYAKKPGYLDKLEARRQAALPLLRFTNRVAKLQASRRACFLVENPLASSAWKRFELDYVTSQFTVRVDMCAYGLKNPDTGALLKKPTRLVTNSAVAANLLARSCPGHVQHGSTDGWLRSERKTVASYAGGYTHEFANAVIDAFTAHFDSYGIFAGDQDFYPEAPLTDFAADEDDTKRRRLRGKQPPPLSLRRPAADDTADRTKRAKRTTTTDADDHTDNQHHRNKNTTGTTLTPFRTTRSTRSGGRSSGKALHHHPAHRRLRRHARPRLRRGPRRSGPTGPRLRRDGSAGRRRRSPAGRGP